MASRTSSGARVSARPRPATIGAIGLMLAVSCVAHAANAAAQTPPAVPGTPSGLQASVVGQQVTLTWTAPTDPASVTSYVIEAGATSGAANLAVFDTGHTATSLVVNAPPGTYYVRVRGRLNGNVGAPTNEVVVAVSNSCVTPQPPNGLTHTVTGNLVQLSWQPAALATTYVLEAGSGPGLADIVSLSTGSLPALNASAPPGTYYVRVRARNACGASAPSDEIVVVVAGCVAPGAPGTLVANVVGAAVTLTWGAAGGNPSGYVVEVGAAPGTTNIGQFNTGAATSFSANAPNGTYYVRVRAVSACGASPASNEVVLNVSAIPPPTANWLSLMNTWRARGGVTAVVEEPAWSVGAGLHARYTVKTNFHPYDPERSSNPWYTPEGSEAGLNSIAVYSQSVGVTDAVVFDVWMSQDWLEILPILDHRLRRVGFGSYREADPGAGISMAAILDVERGRDGDPARLAPALYPAAGAVIPPFHPSYCEGGACTFHPFPGESATCGSYVIDMGIPIIMQFGAGTTPAVSAAAVTSSGISVPVCTFTADTYQHGAASRQQAGRNALRDTGGVVIFPMHPLPAGRNYTVSATVNGQPHQWTFRVQ